MLRFEKERVYLQHISSILSNELNRFFELYDLEVYQINPIAELLILDTNRGKKVLKLWNDLITLKEADWLREEIAKNGFRLFDRFIRTKNGEPFIEWQNEGVVLTDWIEGRVPDSTSYSDTLSMGRTVALLHQALPKSKQSNTFHWHVRFQQTDQQLQKINNNLTEKINKDEVDFAFLKEFSNNQTRIKRALQLMEDDKINLVTYSIHGNLRPESFRIDYYGNTWVLGLGMGTNEILIYDLAKLARVVYQESGYEINAIINLLNSYQELRELSKTERKYLLAYLIYPHNVWKEAYIHYFVRPMISTGNRFNFLLEALQEQNKLDLLVERLEKAWQ